MQNEYELMLVLSLQSVLSDEKKINEFVKTHIHDQGKILSTKLVGKKQLAYPLKSQKEGHFWLLTFSSHTKDISTLTHALERSSDVLRHLLVRNEQKKEKK